MDFFLIYFKQIEGNSLLIFTTIQTSSSLTTVDPSKFTYLTEKVIGSGTFGVVYKAKVKETGQIVAIKKVLQDKRYKNRELQILKELTHPNVLKMMHAYFSQGENVLEYIQTYI